MSGQERPPQTQNLPGTEDEMRPRPIDEDDHYQGSNKLKDKVAIITGGDSGIGKAVAIAFAKEGADLVISYLCEDKDALSVKERVEAFGRQCLLISGDIGSKDHCEDIINQLKNLVN